MCEELGEPSARPDVVRAQFTNEGAQGAPLQLDSSPIGVILAAEGSLHLFRHIAFLRGKKWGPVGRHVKAGRITWVNSLPTEIWETLRSEEHTSELQSLMRISY